jgi:hypothetical protein
VGDKPCECVREAVGAYDVSGMLIVLPSLHERSKHFGVHAKQPMIWIPYRVCFSSAVSVHVHQGSARSGY